MSTPIPRTSSAIIASGFQAVPEGFRAFAGILERELTALTTERDQVRSEVNEAHAATHHWCNRAERAEAAFADAKEERKNVRLKWHAVMGTCAAKADAIIELDEELARLRARAARAEDNLAALEQCHDDNCRGVVLIAAELAKERARLDWVFHNCKVIAADYTIYDREDLGVAMKEDAK